MPSREGFDEWLEAMNGRVDEWHAHGCRQELHEFLSMTWDDYSMFALTPREFYAERVAGRAPQMVLPEMPSPTLVMASDESLLQELKRRGYLGTCPGSLDCQTGK